MFTPIHTSVRTVSLSLSAWWYIFTVRIWFDVYLCRTHGYVCVCSKSICIFCLMSFLFPLPFSKQLSVSVVITVAVVVVVSNSWHCLHYCTYKIKSSTVCNILLLCVYSHGIFSVRIFHFFFSLHSFSFSLSLCNFVAIIIRILCVVKRQASKLQSTCISYL